MPLQDRAVQKTDLFLYARHLQDRPVQKTALWCTGDLLDGQRPPKVGEEIAENTPTFSSVVPQGAVHGLCPRKVGEEIAENTPTFSSVVSQSAANGRCAPVGKGRWPTAKGQGWQRWQGLNTKASPLPPLSSAQIPCEWR